MKVLFVCLDHYPYDGACTSLLKKMLNEGNLRQKLGEVHVLSVKNAYEECDTEIVDNITVHRCFCWSMLSKKKILRMAKKMPLLAAAGITARFFSEMQIPFVSSKVFWRPSIASAVSRKLKELQDKHFDIIIPVCGYYEAAVAALKFIEKKKCGLVLYQVDPCSTNTVFPKSTSKIRAEFERALYEKADAIITTPIIRCEMKDVYSETIMQKTTEMEFPNVSVGKDTPCLAPHSDIRCVFAGKIYPGARDPKYTVGLFERIQNPQIKLHLVGVEAGQLHAYLNTHKIDERIICHGVLGVEKAQQMIQDADILVNIGNIMTNQVPSKIFEYISSCKPIINVCVSEKCPSIPYLNRYPLALQIVENGTEIEEQAERMEKFILENAKKNVDKALVMKEFDTCTAEYCAEQMCEVMQKVIDQTRNNS